MTDPSPPNRPIQIVGTDLTWEQHARVERFKRLFVEVPMSDVERNMPDPEVGEAAVLVPAPQPESRSTGVPVEAGNPEASVTQLRSELAGDGSNPSDSLPLVPAPPEPRIDVGLAVADKIRDQMRHGENYAKAESGIVRFMINLVDLNILLRAAAARSPTPAAQAWQTKYDELKEAILTFAGDGCLLDHRGLVALAAAHAEDSQTVDAK